MMQNRYEIPRKAYRGMLAEVRAFIKKQRFK